MDPAPLVVAFSDSPALRETLSVLLESDCRLRFLHPDGLTDRDPMVADLALVAMRRPAALLDHLARRCPALPIVAVAASVASTSCSTRMPTVSLDPYAIRNAVLQRLPRGSEAGLRATVLQLVERLRAELAYPFAALRSLCLGGIDDADKHMTAIFAAILREQAAALEGLLDQMERFRERPHAAANTPQFAAGLCRALAQPDALAAGHALLCDCFIDPDATSAAGPAAIAPLVAMLLRLHLQRRSAVPVAAARATAAGLVLRYATRAPADSPPGSWPLLLASLALRPSSWHIGTESTDEGETVCVHPA